MIYTYELIVPVADHHTEEPEPAPVGELVGRASKNTYLAVETDSET